MQGCMRGNNAVSSEAKDICNAVSAAIDRAEGSEALFGEKAAAISQLRMLANDCAEAGWDGDNASVIDPIAVRLAESLIRVLPGNIPLPEFAAAPDGSVSLDWIQSKTRLFSLSIGSSNRLAYAWLDGSDRGHAVAGFDGATIPVMILQGIKGIMNHGNNSLRAA